MAVWVAPSLEGFVGNLGVQAIGRSRWWPAERALAAQEVSVWAQAPLLLVHTVPLCELEKAAFLWEDVVLYQGW